MTSVRVFAVIALGIAVGCSATLDFDSRTPDSADGGGSAGDDDDRDAGDDRPSDASSGRDRDDPPPVNGDAGDAGDGGPSPECLGTAGPKSVKVGAYCIDSTEVSNAHYAAFIAAANKPAPPPGCNANQFQPDNFPGANDNPVVRVDWCGAFMFCQWAGKRLCGKIGGGASDNPQTANQWFQACSAGGTKTYPYGATFDDDACVWDEEPVQAVGTAAACVGGSPGIFDMSGNVAEWEDACTGGSCTVRGGHFDDTDEDDLRCASGRQEPRTRRDRRIGFRCCGP